ncbi:MAG: argininosuccinate lyase [Candidatus Nitrospinota bacterium M3_3B_026]
MKKKPWSGRFKEPTNELVEVFNASVFFDIRMWRQDIRASMAHAAMLGRQGIIGENDAEAIIGGLGKVGEEMEAGEFSFSSADEDVHMAVERRLTELIGPVAGKLHTARSRNDQVATDLRLYVRDAIDETVEALRGLQKSLYRKARENVETVAPAYTHLQPAQPIRLASWFLAYYEMFARDVDRLEDARDRVNVMPLGSAALAGTNFPIDRKGVAAELGFDSVSKNSMDAVSDRDFAAEFLFAVAMTGVHLSRLAEELVIFTTAEFSFMELPDAFCTGSSIMPQKKNPDVPELIRGKTGRLTGALVTLLTILKGLPLAYNKDLQEDKEPVFDAHEQIVTMLTIAAEMTGALKVNRERLAERAEEGFMTAVDLADRLVMNGVPFRKAHEVVGRLTRECLDRGLRSFAGLDRETLKSIDPRLEGIDPASLTAARSADAKDTEGGAAKGRIMARLKGIEEELSL